MPSCIRSHLDALNKYDFWKKLIPTSKNVSLAGILINETMELIDELKFTLGCLAFSINLSELLFKYVVKNSIYHRIADIAQII